MEVFDDPVRVQLTLYPRKIAGDSMIAGFALGLSEGLSVEETLKKASAISAAAALREETGFFVKEDMEKIYPQVEIEKIG